MIGKSKEKQKTVEEQQILDDIQKILGSWKDVDVNSLKLDMINLKMDNQKLYQMITLLEKAINVMYDEVIKNTNLKNENIVAQWKRMQN